MTPLTTILLLCLSLIGWGQTATSTKGSPTFGGTITGTTVSYGGLTMGVIINDTAAFKVPAPRFDTAEIIMLCTRDDEAGFAFEAKGFEIVRDSAYAYQKYHNPNYSTDGGITTTLMGGIYSTGIGHVRTHVVYLDIDRQKLPKSLIVWMVK